MAEASVKVAPRTADPTFRFTIAIPYQYRYSIPLHLIGHVRAEDGTVLGDLAPVPEPGTPFKHGILPRSSQNEPQQIRSGDFDCRLTQRAIEYLIETRERNPKKDVILHLTLLTSAFYPKFSMGTGQVPGSPAGLVTGEQTTWGPGLGEISSEAAVATVTIFSSQWTTDYAPVFGIGRFVVFELPELTSPPAGGSALATRLAAAFAATRVMLADLQAGEWTDCVEHSRAVAELLRDPTELRVILQADGLSDSAADDLLKAVRGAFDFASKFLKRLERGTGDVNPTLVAKKEDAYYVLSNSLTLVNLLSRKSARSTSRAGPAPPPP